MLVLGLDTSGASLSLVLTEGGEARVRRRFAERRGQSEAVLPLVDSALREVGRPLRALGALAAVTGPGSFTGLRLGLAAVQGLGRALGCPVGGFDRFSLLAHGVTAGKEVPSSGNLAIVLDSFRPELFVKWGEAPPEMLTPDVLNARFAASPHPWWAVGDGVAYLDTTRFTGLPLPDGAELAAQAATRLLAEGRSLPSATPFYLRPPDVTHAKPLLETCPA